MVEEFKGPYQGERLAQELLILFDQAPEEVRLNFHFFTHADSF
jgi:hypothetical protein